MKRIMYLTILTIIVLVTVSYAGPIISYNVPSKHIIFYAKTSFGIIPIIIPKGSLNANKEHKSWDTPENFFKREQHKLEAEKKSDKIIKQFKKKYPEAFGKRWPI